mgnify:CR=1 FL=1
MRNCYLAVYSYCFVGKVGSWKADFTVEQNEIADEWIRNGRKGLEDIKLIFE